MKIIFSILTLFIALNAFAQPAGSLDPSFGNGGKVITSISSGQDQAYGVVVQSDGKIIVVGYSSNTTTGKDFAVLRYKKDGNLDSSFGTNGIVTTDLQIGSDDVAYSVALQADGNIVLGGYSDDGSDKNAAIVRYKKDGTLDSSFGTNGIVLTDFESSQQDEIKVLKIHAITGNIVVGGASIISSSVSKPVVARYSSNGTIDSSFDDDGIRLLWITSLDYQYLYSVEDLVVQSNGKISAVGWREFPKQNWTSDYWACRINSNGTMDNTFSSDGVNIYNGGFNGHDRGYAMMLKSNNNFLMAGGGYVSTIGYDFTIFEINANGTTGSFSSKADFGSNIDDIAHGLVEDSNGKLILAGSSGSKTDKTFALARFNTDATLDSDFGSSGKITTTFGSSRLNECFGVASQTDNKIIAVGYTGNDFAIARYLGEDVPELDNFNLISPNNNSTNQNFASISFDWSDAFGATSYQIEIDDNQTFSSPQTYTSSTSNYTAKGLLPNTQYYWRVSASDGKVWGVTSTAWSFKTNTLENFNLISPANGSVNKTYTSLVIDWSDNVGATMYEVQLDTTQDFSTNPTSVKPSSSTTTMTLLPSKTYYWKVRASDGTTWGQWTTAWSFTTKADQSMSAHEIYFSGFKIYPNPISDKITLEANSVLLNTPFKLLDNTGRVLFSDQIHSEEVNISFKDLTSGIYFLVIGDFPQRTFRLVKE